MLPLTSVASSLQHPSASLPVKAKGKAAKQGAADDDDDDDAERQVEDVQLPKYAFLQALEFFEKEAEAHGCTLGLLDLLMSWMTIFSCSYFPTAHLVRPFLRQVRDLVDDLLDDGVQNPNAAPMRRDREPPASTDEDKAFVSIFDDEFGSIFNGYYHAIIYRMAELLAPTHWRPDSPFTDPDKEEEEEKYWYEFKWSYATIDETMTAYCMFYLRDPHADDDAAVAADAVGPPPEPINPRAVNPRRWDNPRVVDKRESEVLLEVKAFNAEITASDFQLAETAHWYDDFWASRRDRYPNLWKVARLILAIPASSVAVESLFSVMKAVDSPKRQSMTTERMCRLTVSNYIRFF